MFEKILCEKLTGVWIKTETMFFANSLQKDSKKLLMVNAFLAQQIKLSQQGS